MIERIVEETPELGSRSELIFVEGHSTDGTRRGDRAADRAASRSARSSTSEQTGQGQGRRRAARLRAGPLRRADDPRRRPDRPAAGAAVVPRGDRDRPRRVRERLTARVRARAGRDALPQPAREQGRSRSSSARCSASRSRTRSAGRRCSSGAATRRSRPAARTSATSTRSATSTCCSARRGCSLKIVDLPVRYQRAHLRRHEDLALPPRVAALPDGGVRVPEAEDPDLRRLKVDVRRGDRRRRSPPGPGRRSHRGRRGRSRRPRGSAPGARNRGPSTRSSSRAGAARQG